MAKRSGEMWSRSPWPRGASSFVRRSATVTISAPAASAQARFCSKEAYLPVPMIRRERNARAPSLKPSASLPSIQASSAPSHRLQDLDPVAAAEGVGREARARHDVPVHRHRDAPAVDAEAHEQALD